MKSSPEDQKAEKRRRAEELLSARLQGPLASQTQQSLEELLHELAVHQIELEMQNEELRRTEDRLETARKKYADLYNFAPVGYFVFDKKGKILEANSAGARMLGMEESRDLEGKIFFTFCEKASGDEFYLHLRRVMKTRESERCELVLHKEDGAPFNAMIESVAAQDEDGNYNQYQSALIDITDRKRAEAALRQAHDQLEDQVRERTVDLAQTNEALRNEITERNRAEEALRRALAEAEEGRQILHAMMEHIPMGITIADAPDVRIRAVSRYGQELTGRPREQIEGIAVEQHSAQWGIFRADGVTPATNEDLPLTRATQQGELVKEEVFVIAQPDGTKVPILCNAAPIRDDQGNITGGVIGWQDITARIQAEETLRQRTEELQTILDTTPVAIFMAHDPECGKITGNPAAQALVELPPHANISKSAPAEEQPTQWQEMRDGVPIEPGNLPLQRAARGEEIRDYEMDLVFKDGTVKSVVGNATPIRDENGMPRGSVAILMEITERKRSEEALRQSERRERERAAELTTLLDATPTPVFIVHDPDGTHITGNRAADDLLRLPSGGEVSLSAPAEIKPRHFKAIKDGRELGTEELPAQRAARGVEVRDFEFSLVFDDGTIRHLLGYGTPLRDDDGRSRGAVHVLVDITERKRAEEALNKANEQLLAADHHKDEFLAMLAHELRNPLAPVRNAVAVLQYAGSTDPRLQRQSDIINRQVTHMARLLDDLLDVSRITRGKIDLQRQPLHLTDVLAHAVETATPLIQARKHTVHVTEPPDELLIEGDRDRLAQVVGNLLMNALKYTPEGGEIWLEAGREVATGEDDRAVIRVRDNGMGIAPEMLPRVFELFTQADRTLGHAQGGLGIGLTMVNRLVQMHGGTVEAHSAGLGYGSEFIVRLPALVAEVKELPARPPEPEKQIRKYRQRRILVVDDVVDTAESLTELLGLWGHEVHKAHDGLAALDAIRQFRPEVVLLDIGMPGMDGFEVARYLRQEYQNQSMLLVALTGYAQESDRRETQQAGFDAHLSKPVDLEALRELLDQPAAGSS